MTKLSLLRVFTKVLYIIFTIALILMPGLILMEIINPSGIPEELRIIDENDTIATSVILMLSMLIESCLIVYSLYIFRKVLESFSKKAFFENAIIKNFKHIGLCVLIILFLEALPGFITYSAENESNFSVDLFDVLFISIVGLFFLVLSEVFKMAKNLKEDNDLTI